ncbi:MAG: hypothetical protein AAFR21_14930 [Pseudomonadota bacterium]
MGLIWKLLLSRAGRGVAAFLAVLGFGWLKRLQGAHRAEVKQRERIKEAGEKKKDIEDEINELDDASLRERANQWVQPK